MNGLIGLILVAFFTSVLECCKSSSCKFSKTSLKKKPKKLQNLDFNYLQCKGCSANSEWFGHRPPGLWKLSGFLFQLEDKQAPKARVENHLDECYDSYATQDVAGLSTSKLWLKTTWLPLLLPESDLSVVLSLEFNRRSNRLILLVKTSCCTSGDILWKAEDQQSNIEDILSAVLGPSR